AMQKLARAEIVDYPSQAAYIASALQRHAREGDREGVRGVATHFGESVASTSRYTVMRVRRGVARVAWGPPQAIHPELRRLLDDPAFEDSVELGQEQSLDMAIANALMPKPKPAVHSVSGSAPKRSTSPTTSAVTTPGSGSVEELEGLSQ